MKTIHIKDVGLVSIRKNKQSKSLRATLQPDNTYNVSIPRYVTYKEAEKFLIRQKSKLMKMQQNHREKTSGYEIYDQGRIYKTKFHEYSIEYHNQNNLLLKPEENNKLKILVPHALKITDDETQYFLRQVVRDIYRHEAKRYIIPRTERYARQYKLDFNRITIKNTKSRWGSCSSKRNLNLNLNLMRLPDELIDYVILHELAHLKHQNHSAEFWQFLGNMIENPRSLSQQLKQYSLRHFAT